MFDFNVVAEDLLAKLLAAEDISIEHSTDVSTAMFDANQRVLILPVWTGVSKHLRDMLKVHETGHAIDTPADIFDDKGENPRGGVLDALNEIAKNVYGEGFGDNQKMAAKHALNVCEDVRVDRRQKRRFPGSRKDYRIGCNELWERDFFGVTASGKSVDEMNIMDRINIRFKGGTEKFNIPFSKKEEEFVSRLEVAETWDEIKSLSTELLKMSIDEAQIKNQDAPDSTSPDSTGKPNEGEDAPSKKIKIKRSDLNKMKPGAGGGGQTSQELELEIEEDCEPNSEKDEEDQTEGTKGTKGKGSGGDSDEEEDVNKETSQPSGGGREGGKTEGVATPISETMKAMEEKLSKIVEKGKGYYYCTLPEPDLSVIVDDYKKVLKAHRNAFKGAVTDSWRGNVKKWRSAETPTIAYMVKEFEMRKAADMYSKISQSKTGVLNMNKIHSYTHSEDVFKRNSILPQGKNHGFVMFLDCSGSMVYQMEDTVKQIASLVIFCKRVQIPFEVYLFRDLAGGESNNLKYWKKGKNVIPSPFKLRNIFSSRMSAGELDEAMSYLFRFHKENYNPDPLGGTPLNEAIIAANAVVMDFKKRTKVQIVNTIILTDGASNNLGFIDTRANHKHIIFKDEKTKKTFSTVIERGFGNITSTLVRYLKETTGCMTIGMYLSSGDSFYTVENWLPKDTTFKEKEKLKKLWDDNHFTPISGGCGYDEYFVLKSMKNVASTTKRFTVDSGKNNKEIGEEFSSFMKKKSVNKVLLSRFISLIVEEKKLKKKA